MDFVFQTATGLSEYGGEILRLLYQKYADEMKRFPCLKYMSRDRFQAYIGQRFPHTKAVVGMEDGLVSGVLLYRSWEQRGEKHIDIPVYGYGASRAGGQDHWKPVPIYGAAGGCSGDHGSLCSPLCP